jgi:hypothetical protein
MMGDERMKKDRIMNIINNQTNSPDAIQQTGAGNFSQQAFTEQNQPMIAAIDAALARRSLQTSRTARAGLQGYCRCGEGGSVKTT